MTASSELTTAQRVRDANRRLYDLVGTRYEAIDGRRSPHLHAWLRGQLSSLRSAAPGGRLLDIGAGAGLVTRCADGLFRHRVAVDLSPVILAGHRSSFDAGVAADVDHLPFADHTFDVITCFATLHHLPAFHGFAAEISRLLAPGGLFYSDHDMDERFYRRFGPLLTVYRRLHDARARYTEADAAISQDLYDMAEWHQTGIPSSNIYNLLQATGLTVVTRYHWYGLHPVTDHLLGTTSRTRGWAPLLSILARQPQRGRQR